MKKEDEENSGPCTPSVPETKYVTALETAVYDSSVETMLNTKALHKQTVT